MEENQETSRKDKRARIKVICHIFLIVGAILIIYSFYLFGQAELYFEEYGSGEELILVLLIPGTTYLMIGVILLVLVVIVYKENSMKKKQRTFFSHSKIKKNTSKRISGQKD